MSTKTQATEADRQAIIEAQHSLGRPLPTQSAAADAADRLAKVGGAASFAPEDLEIVARGIVVTVLGENELPLKVIVNAETLEMSIEPIVVDRTLSPEDDHDCDANAVPYVSDGALGHGWECGVCGSFLQAG